MAHNEMRPPALDTRNGLGIDKASTASVPKHSAALGRRQLRAPARSILSADDWGSRDDLTVSSRAAAWLARRAAITVHHAAALAEAHGIGGAA